MGIDVTYAHDNRELSDYVVENNQKRLIFANGTEKWYTWRVFTGAVGIKKGAASSPTAPNGLTLH